MARRAASFFKRVSLTKEMHLVALQAATFILGPFVLGPVIRKFIVNSRIKKMFRRQMEMELAFNARKYARSYGMTEEEFLLKIGHFARKRLRDPKVKTAIKAQISAAKMEGRFEGDVRSIERSLRALAHTIILMFQIRTHIGDLKNIEVEEREDETLAFRGVRLRDPVEHRSELLDARDKISSLEKAAREVKEKVINDFESMRGELERADYRQLYPVIQDIQKAYEKIEKISRSLSGPAKSITARVNKAEKSGALVFALSDLVNRSLEGEISASEIDRLGVKSEVESEGVSDYMKKTMGKLRREYKVLTPAEKRRVSVSGEHLAKINEIKNEWNERIGKLFERIMMLVAKEEKKSKEAISKRKLSSSARDAIINNSIEYATGIRDEARKVLKDYRRNVEMISSSGPYPEQFKVVPLVISGERIRDITYDALDGGSFVKGAALPALTKLRKLSRAAESHFGTAELTKKQEDDRRISLLMNPGNRELVQLRKEMAPLSSAGEFINYANTRPGHSGGMNIVINSPEFEGVRNYKGFIGNNAKLAKAFDLVKEDKYYKDRQKYRKSREFRIDASPGIHFDDLGALKLVPDSELKRIYSIFYSYTDQKVSEKEAGTEAGKEKQKELTKGLESNLSPGEKEEKKAIKAELALRRFNEFKGKNEKKAAEAKNAYKRYIMDGRHGEGFRMEVGDVMERIQTKEAARGKTIIERQRAVVGMDKEGLPILLDNEGRHVGRPDFGWKLVPHELERVVPPPEGVGKEKRLRQLLSMTAEEYVDDQMENARASVKRLLERQFRNKYPKPTRDPYETDEEFAQRLIQYDKDMDDVVESKWGDMEDDLRERFADYYCHVVIESLTNGTLLKMLARRFREEFGGKDGLKNALKSVTSAYRLAAGTKPPPEVVGLLSDAWHNYRVPGEGEEEPVDQAIYQSIKSVDPMKGVMADYWVISNKKTDFMRNKKKIDPKISDNELEKVYTETVRNAILDGMVHEYAISHPVIIGGPKAAGSSWEYYADPESEEGSSGRRIARAEMEVAGYNNEDIGRLFLAAFGKEPPKEFIASVEQARESNEIPDDFKDKASAEAFFDKINYPLEREMMQESLTPMGNKRDDPFDHLWELIISPGSGIDLGVGLATDYVTRQELRKAYLELRKRYMHRIPEIMKARNVSQEEAKELLAIEIWDKLRHDKALADKLRYRIEHNPARVAGALFGILIGSAIYTLLHHPIKRSFKKKMTEEEKTKYRPISSPEARKILLGGSIKFMVSKIAAVAVTKIAEGVSLDQRAKREVGNMIQRQIIDSLAQSGINVNMLTSQQQAMIVREVEKRLETPAARLKIDSIKLMLKDDPDFIKSKKNIRMIVHTIAHLITLPFIFYKLFKGIFMDPKRRSRDFSYSMGRTGVYV